MRRGWVAATLAAPLLAFVACEAHAQAGPPMITNDPGTPGPGAWEVNLAAAGSHGQSGWAIDAPDVDVNYGVGERVQLSAHTALAHARAAGGGFASGRGDLELGVRWRFLDQAVAGVDVAIQPLWVRGWSGVAVRKGLASANPEFVLPVQVARDFGPMAAGFELARHFVRNEDDAWQLGVFAARGCARGATCLLEVNASRADAGRRTAAIVNAGWRRPLAAGRTLMGSLGWGTAQEGGHAVVAYLGVQFATSD
jgi:hypothetical protein